MRLLELSIHGYQRITSLAIQPSAPVTLLSGDNESGKSSTLDALRHAITGEPARVAKKKDYPALVNTAAKVGYARAKFDLGECCITLPNGAHERQFQAAMALPFVLDPGRFMGLDDAGRRDLFFSMSGLSGSGKEAVNRLQAKGLDTARTIDIIPILSKAGFAAAQAEAKGKAKEARGAWKAVAGEAYGDVKAATWAAPKPEVPDSTELLAQESALRAEHQQAAEDIAEKRAALKIHASQEAQRAALQVRAERLPRIREKLARDQAEHDQWAARLAELPPAHGDAAVAVPHACPDCGSALVLRNGQLEAYAPPKADDPETAVKRREWQKAVALYGSAVANGKRDLSDAEAAENALKALEEGQPAVKASDVEGLEVRFADLTARWRAAADELAAHNLARQQAEAAERITAKAAGYHADVQGWEAMAAALEQIPAEMLAEAMGPVNDRLRETAGKTGWSQIVIGPDMGVTVGAHPYSLSSKSAQWRAAVAIAEAISHLSGLRFLCLDEMDILSPRHRLTCLKWLHGLAKSGELESAVVAGTFRDPPQAPAVTFDVRWLESGALAQLMKEAA